MISQSKIHQLVRTHISFLRKSKIVWQFLAKRAETVAISEYGSTLGYKTKEMRTEEGEAYSHFWLPQRTAFKPLPVSLDREDWYIEIKGYGYGGRHLMPFHHPEGDLHFGMYFENAQKEYNFLNIASRIPNRVSQKAVALLKFPKDEFVYQCVRGLAWLIARKESKNLTKSEEKIANKFFRIYSREGLESMVVQIVPYLESFPHVFKEFEFIKKPAGYLVRLARTPFRLADNRELRLPMRELQEAAYEAGRLYSSLIERGYIHLVPSIGNITISGELTDFEDVERVPISMK